MQGIVFNSKSNEQLGSTYSTSTISNSKPLVSKVSTHIL